MKGQWKKEADTSARSIPRGSDTVTPGRRQVAIAGSGMAAGWVLALLLLVAFGAYLNRDRVQAFLRLQPATAEAGGRPAQTPPAAVPQSTPSPRPPQPTAPADIAATATAATPAAAPVVADRPADALPPLRRLIADPPRRSGRAGLVEAMRAGEIRLASAYDVSRWTTRYISANGRAPGREFEERVQHFPIYLVQRDFEIPADLAGGNAVTFIVESRVPFPRGEPGHSTILDMDGGGCEGVLCPRFGQ